jgi:hypothetical protein
MILEESLEGKWETKFEFWLSKSCAATAEKQYGVSHGRYVF